MPKILSTEHFGLDIAATNLSLCGVKLIFSLYKYILVKVQFYQQYLLHFPNQILNRYEPC